MYRQMEIQLLHQQQFIVQNDIGRLLTVAFNIRHELLDGNVKFLHFAGEVYARNPKTLLAPST